MPFLLQGEQVVFDAFETQHATDEEMTYVAKVYGIIQEKLSPYAITMLIELLRSNYCIHCGMQNLSCKCTNKYLGDNHART